MASSRNEISSYAKLTAQDVSDQYLQPVSMNGAEMLFKNSAFANMVQPIIVMLRTQALLETALESWNNCQALLLQSANAPIDGTKDEQGASYAREQIFKDKESLDTTTDQIIALGMTLKSIHKVINSFLKTQLNPIHQDLTTLKNLCKELGVAETDNLAESIFAALYNSQNAAKDYGVDFNSLTPLKKALVVAFSGKITDANKIDINTILNSESVKNAETRINKQVTHNNVAQMGEQTSQNIFPILNEIESGLTKIVKKFEKLEPLTTSDCNNYVRQLGTSLQKLIDEKPSANTLGIS